MCKKSTYLILSVFVFVLVAAGVGKAAEPGLIGWWKFEEGSGAVARDSSGNGNNGALKGNPQWVAGKTDLGLELDGNGDYVEVGGVGISRTAPRTIAGWARASTTSIASWTAVFGFAPGGSTDGTYFDIEVDDAGNYAVHIYGWDAVISPVDTEWHHLAATYNGTGGSWYLDGRLVDSLDGAIGTIDQFRIGARVGSSNFFPGIVDDVRVYNRSLTPDEIKKLAAGPRAYEPYPEDGTIYKDTTVTLGWRGGDGAVSHDVYLSDNFDDVNDGVTEAFQGNQTATFLSAGYAGNAFPDGLVPGTTYYWRIDEIQADGLTMHKGDIWSFTVPSKSAYNPEPADGAKFIDLDADLSWTTGFEAKLHTVYFGDNFDDVNDATGGLPRPTTGYKPGPLESGKTYYWRVDEFDAFDTHRGNVWTFTTAGPGGGVKGQYYKGTNFENLVLTRVDPQIDFSWGNGEPDPAVGADGFSVRWVGDVEAAFTETYTFYTNSDDGVRLWVDGRQLVNNWTNHGPTEDSGRIDLVAGQKYSVVMELYEDGGGAVGQLRWESPRTPKQLIPRAALSQPLIARRPRPINGAVGARLVDVLRWQAGDLATSHDVYFGTDKDAVANATNASPEYAASKALGDESFDPGKLAWDTTYYWRVDEVNDAHPDSPWVGNIWSFGTGDFLVVDGFESYDDIDPPPGQPGVNRIFDKWIDGFGTTTNGALVGNDLPPYAEQTIVHGGAQSMPYLYDNANKTSEATLTLVYPRDWTEEGVSKLSLWVNGGAANAADRIFVALNGTSVVYHDDPAATQIAGWNHWVIDLQAFAGVNLTNVNTITIGIGTKNSPAAGGAGQVYLDDIRLIR